MIFFTVEEKVLENNGSEHILVNGSLFMFVINTLNGIVLSVDI